MPFLLPDIADNASGGAGSLESTSSSASSGSAGETDSLGGGGGHRNSSPENAMAAASNPAASNKLLKKMEVEDPRLGRLSPMVLSRPSHLRPKQQLLAGAGKLRKSSNALSTGDLGYHTMVNGSSSGTGGSSSNNSTMETVSAVVGRLLEICN